MILFRTVCQCVVQSLFAYFCVLLFTCLVYSWRLHERLLELWKQSILCDVIIRTCDGIVPCHSAMLSAHCKYWGEFCSESTGDACRMPHSPVELDFRRRVTGLGIRVVLNYLYTGRIKVDHHNCVEVFDAARALKIRDLTHLTERFIKVLLQDHNLWSTVSATRDRHPSSIFDIAWTKLATRFVRLSKTPEFKLLELDDLMWFLQSDELLVSVLYYCSYIIVCKTICFEQVS